MGLRSGACRKEERRRESEWREDSEKGKGRERGRRGWEFASLKINYWVWPAAVFCVVMLRCHFV